MITLQRYASVYKKREKKNMFLMFMKPLQAPELIWI